MQILRGMLVGGEVLLAGGTIELSRTAVIAGDLLAAAGGITVDGTIGGSAKIRARRVTLNGTIRGDAEGTADECTRLDSWTDGNISGRRFLCKSICSTL